MLLQTSSCSVANMDDVQRSIGQTGNFGNTWDSFISVEASSSIWSDSISFMISFDEYIRVCGSSINFTVFRCLTDLSESLDDES